MLLPFQIFRILQRARRREVTPSTSSVFYQKGKTVGFKAVVLKHHFHKSTVVSFFSGGKLGEKRQEI